MYMANKSAFGSIATATWHTVGSTSGNEFSEGLTSTNWSFASNRLTASGSLSSTVFLVKFSLSFGADQATWQVGISKNGATPSTILYRRTISNEQKDAGVVYGIGYMTLTANDYIELCVKQETGSAKDFDPLHAQVVLLEMTDNSTNYYGGMKIEGNSTAQTSIPTSYTPSTTTFSINELNNDWTVSSNELVAGSGAAGTYLVSFSASYSGKGTENSPETYDIGLALGSGTDPTTIITKRKTASTDVGNICGVGLLTISASDPLRLEIKSARNNGELTLYYSSISLYKISGTSTAPRGHMTISSATDLTISDNNFTTITGFSAGSSLYNWTFSSNALNATSGTPSAGNYLVDYAVSFQKASGTSNDAVIAAFSVFLDASEQTELTIKRKLSDSTDVGAAGGTGLINIASASTSLTLQVKNESSTDNLTINSCAVNLHRFVEGSHDGSLPVELISFSGKSVNASVILNWETASEVENLGFIIERRQSAEEWVEIASYKTNENLRGQGSVTHNTSYSFSDEAVIPGQTYLYRLGDVDYSGKLKYHHEISVTVNAIDDTEHPKTFVLRPAYPNPFNPTTRIQYDLLKAANITVDIYDITGKLVKILINQQQEPGLKQVAWDATDRTGNQVGASIYLYRIDAGNYSKTGKLILIK